MNDYINYYDLLGISKNASDEEIKKAYRNNAKKWHPDLNKDPKAPEMAKKINEAKEILLNKEKRKEYDEYLNNYKNDIYDNLDKNKNNKSKYNDNYYEEKTYTKWEYFMLYLKYYKVNIFRKILSSLFVFIESLICTVLQIINYILALIVSYIGYYLSYAFAFIGGLLIMAVLVKVLFDFNVPLYSFIDYLLVIISSIFCFTLASVMEKIPDFLISKVSVLISKLNMFLFKLSIGYNKLN